MGIFLSVWYRSCGHSASWVLGLRIYSSGILRVFFGQILRVGYFLLRSGGVQDFRVEFGWSSIYASGGASFACCHKGRQSQYRLLRDLCLHSGGKCLSSGDEWWTVGAIDCSSGAAAGGRGSSFGSSIFLGGTRYEYIRPGLLDTPGCRETLVTLS